MPNFGYQCDLSNDTKRTLFNIDLPLHFNRNEMIRVAGQEHSYQQGKTVGESNMVVSVTRMESLEKYRFYISNETEQFIVPSAPKYVTVSESGDERKSIPLRLSTTTTYAFRDGEMAESAWERKKK